MRARQGDAFLLTHEPLIREQFFRDLQCAEHAVLLLDYDGTLAPFHPDPQQAFPYPGVANLLAEIMRGKRTRVVFVTGRRAQDLVSLLNIFPPPEIWGCHGLQRLLPDGSQEVMAPDEAVALALSEAAALLHEGGLRQFAEFKPGSIAVHWRDQTPAQAASVRATVHAGWEPIARRARLKLENFDGGLEIRMSGRDKGDVVRMIVEETDGRVPIAFLGNDAPDEEAFRALSGSGLSVLVSAELRETAADIWIRPPEELLQFLQQWLEARRAGPAASSCRGGSNAKLAALEPGGEP